MELPRLTDGQRAEYLRLANEARERRAAAKEDLKLGRATLAEALGSAEEAWRGMPVRDLLRSLPGIGPARADALMGKLGIKPNRRVRGLGCHQREALLAAWGRLAPAEREAR